MGGPTPFYYIIINTMKRFAIILLISFSSLFCCAENETAKPSFGVVVEREVSQAQIEGKMYFNVLVELKSSNFPGSGVKVTVASAKTGVKIYKKRYASSYLYGFSDKSLQVGKGNILTQLIIYKTDSGWMMKLREKGIY